MYFWPVVISLATMRGGLGTPDTPIYSLGILGYKRPQVGVFFLTVHSSTRVTQAYGPMLEGVIQRLRRVYVYKLK